MRLGFKFSSSEKYSGNRINYLCEIATYTIENYGIYVNDDMHSLAGGIKVPTIGE